MTATAPTTYARRLIRAGLPRANAQALITEAVRSRGWTVVSLRSEPVNTRIFSCSLRFDPNVNLFERYGITVQGPSLWVTAIRSEILSFLNRAFLSNKVVITRPRRDRDGTIFLD